MDPYVNPLYIERMHLNWTVYYPTARVSHYKKDVLPEFAGLPVVDFRNLPENPDGTFTDAACELLFRSFPMESHARFAQMIPDEIVPLSAYLDRAQALGVLTYVKEV